MGDLLKIFLDTTDGKSYTADAMKSQDVDNKHNNVEPQKSLMSNPRILKHSYDEDGMSQPKTVIAEDESK